MENHSIAVVVKKEFYQMRFLDTPPLFLFFTGKGGGGKTSLACATAVYLADLGKRVLLVSTDPASNVHQVFGSPIGSVITPIDGIDGLSALEIDPQAAAKAYREHAIDAITGSMPEAIIKDVAERLSGACTTEIATFDKFTALLTDKNLLAIYDHIIFDTAPTGHTLRLLKLPGAWSDFLMEGKGNASCLGPLSGLQKQQAQYKAAVDVLANAQMTRMILVARPQRSSMNEAARTSEELAAIGLKNQYLAINAIFPLQELENDIVAASIVQREQGVLDSIPLVIQNIPTDHIACKSFNVVGLPALRHLFNDSAPLINKTNAALPTVHLPKLASIIDEIATTKNGLIMLVGKGGVGKTTLASAIAVGLASRGFSVHLTTSDPAAHLTQTVDGAINNLTVSRIDPRVETERYREHIVAIKGKNMTSQEKAVLEEDLQSPCTEEVAVFGAFSRLVREANNRFVVMDTAPTGHTLLLLDLTGAYHRDIVRQMSGSDAPR